MILKRKNAAPERSSCFRKDLKVWFVGTWGDCKMVAGPGRGLEVTGLEEWGEGIGRQCTGASLPILRHHGPLQISIRPVPRVAALGWSLAGSSHAGVIPPPAIPNPYSMGRRISQFAISGHRKSTQTQWTGDDTVYNSVPKLFGKYQPYYNLNNLNTQRGSERTMAIRVCHTLFALRPANDMHFALRGNNSGP